MNSRRCGPTLTKGSILKQSRTQSTKSKKPTTRPSMAASVLASGGIRNLIVVSDIHAGCRMGLCPDPGIQLDGGGWYGTSPFQDYMWGRWLEFWADWVPHVTKGEPWALIVNGDTIDGVHHGATTQVSHNLNDQANIARKILEPVVAQAAAYYHIRGTEAHVGKSGAEEERLARELGAIPDSNGEHARWELWHEMQGPDGKPRLVHFTHHIGTTGSSSYEATAIGKEMVEMFVETGRWGNQSADVLIRSHRHRYSQVQMYGVRGLQICAVTPGWQGKTPFGYKIAGRMSPPQFGGMLVRVGDEGLYTRAKVWSLGRE